MVNCVSTTFPFLLLGETEFIAVSEAVTAKIGTIKVLDTIIRLRQIVAKSLFFSKPCYSKMSVVKRIIFPKNETLYFF